MLFLKKQRFFEGVLTSVKNGWGRLCPAPKEGDGAVKQANELGLSAGKCCLERNRLVAGSAVVRAKKGFLIHPDPHKSEKRKLGTLVGHLLVVEDVGIFFSNRDLHQQVRKVYGGGRQAGGAGFFFEEVDDDIAFTGVDFFNFEDIASFLFPAQENSGYVVLFKINRWFAGGDVHFGESPVPECLKRFGGFQHEVLRVFNQALVAAE